MPYPCQLQRASGLGNGGWVKSGERFETAESIWEGSIIGGRVKFKETHFNKNHCFSIGREMDGQKYYLAIPVSNRLVDYEEYYEISYQFLRGHSPDFYAAPIFTGTQPQPRFLRGHSRYWNKYPLVSPGKIHRCRRRSLTDSRQTLV
jgi:hypothetical protein